MYGLQIKKKNQTNFFNYHFRKSLQPVQLPTLTLRNLTMLATHLAASTNLWAN